MGTDLGLLFLRLGAGGMMFLGHGLAKITNFSAYAARFSDPLGLGPTASLILAIFAEAFCSCLVVSGFVTRLAAIPLVVTMCVAGFIVHANDPWARTEFALLYGVCFLTLIFTGPGRISLDYLVYTKRKLRGAVFRP